ncbi:ABC transporter [Mesobacillus thioparans]
MSNGVHAACSVFDLFLAVLVGVGLILLSTFGLVAAVLAVLGAAFAAIVNTIVGIIGLIVVLLFAYCLLRRLWRCCFGGRC